MDADHDNAGSRLPAWRGLAGCTLAVGALFVWIGAPSPAPVLVDDPVAPVVVVYGNSLTPDAQALITTKLTAAYPDGTVVVRPAAGTAPCDWLASMARDAEMHPDVVVIALARDERGACATQSSGAETQLDYRDQALAALDLDGKTGGGPEVVLVPNPDGVAGVALRALRSA